MKPLFFFLLLFASLTTFAQDPVPCWPDAPYLPWESINPDVYSEHLEPLAAKQVAPQKEPAIQPQMPLVQLPENLDIHFISPEPIQYVDISAKNIIGDLPLKNVLRIRYKDSTKAGEAVVTIAGEKFIAQYHIRPGGVNVPLEIEIEPGDSKPLDISGIGLSQNQLRQLALGLFQKKPARPVEKTKAFGMVGTVNHIYTLDEYIFVDLGFQNKTNLKFDIEQFRFRIDDKKITKATNVQSLELKPAFILFNQPLFLKTYRNIIVLKKMTFPGDKVLHVELSEKQVSGRVITLTVSYQDVLNADVLPI